MSVSRTRSFALGSAFVLMLLAPHCKTGVGSEAQAAPPQAARAPERAQEPVVELEPVGGSPVRVRVELAQTPEQRQRGLMFRKQLAPDAGMLFIFEHPQHNVFWMHNTYLPLDMIFITADWNVLGVVENATPQTDSPREVPGISAYVLEVNAGFSRQYGIAAGTKARLIKPAR
ncbi:MAG TPA: DUF192 domain-containing protein [Polyangiales bacterium]|nr:DUF192 domain-containing protein [Polyangiales bacterium]